MVGYILCLNTIQKFREQHNHFLHNQTVRIRGGGGWEEEAYRGLGIIAGRFWSNIYGHICFLRLYSIFISWGVGGCDFPEGLPSLEWLQPTVPLVLFPHLQLVQSHIGPIHVKKILKKTTNRCEIILSYLSLFCFSWSVFIFSVMSAVLVPESWRKKEKTTLETLVV